MVALQLDDAALDRAADAAALLEPAGEVAQAVVVERDAGHRGDRLAAPAARLATDLDAPARALQLARAGDVGGVRLAQVAVVAGPDDAALARALRHHAPAHAAPGRASAAWANAPSTLASRSTHSSKSGSLPMICRARLGSGCSLAACD